MTYQYDVFLSYSSKDKPIVLDLATRLKKDGLRVWFDEWEIKPGDMIGKKIDDGLEASRVLILCMSKNATESDWATMESGTFRFRDPVNTRRRFIPLLLEDCIIKESLRQFAYVDWSNKADTEYLRLLGACKQNLDEFSKPSSLNQATYRSMSLGHPNWIQTVALSSDGTRAISGSSDNNLRVWEVDSGRCISVLEGHTATVFCVSLSGDGKRAISASDDKTLRVWDIERGCCIKVLKGHSARVWSVTLSLNGQRAISASDDKTLRVWDVENGHCIGILEEHSGSVLCVSISSDGNQAVSCSSDKTLRVWNVESLRCIKILSTHNTNLLCISLNSDGSRAVSGSSNKTLQIWDIKRGCCVKILEGHSYSVLSVALSADGMLAVSASDDQTIRVWNLNLGLCTCVLSGHTDSVMSVALSSDGSRALSGSNDKMVRLWDLNKCQCVSVLEGHTASVFTFALNIDGTRGISGSDDSTICVWYINDGRFSKKLKGHQGSVLSVALSQDGLQAISGSSDKTIRVWQVESGLCSGVLIGHLQSVLSVALSTDGKIAVSGSHDKTIRVWDTENHQCIMILGSQTSSVFSVALSSNSKRVIAGSIDGMVRIWEIKNGQPVANLAGHREMVNCVALNSDGNFALSGSKDKTVRFWEVDSGSCVGVLEGHTESVLTVALNCEGNRAVSGSEDKTVRIWDIDHKCCMATLEGHTNDVRSVAFNLDGTKIYSSDVNGIMRIWDINDILKRKTLDVSNSLYTNAKVLLVGDSGVGKTGLSYRLTEGIFRESFSTDGAWATQMKLPQLTSEGIERDVWLWDFAGQSDYRLIAQLYMDETALAVLVFNPQSENPFEGLGQWERGLTRAARRKFNKLLVSGRIDRGGLMISRTSINQFLEERGFVEYIETSALLGTGCDTLRKSIEKYIPWKEISWTSSPRIFKLIKNEIIKLKSEGKVLLRIGELKQQLELRLPNEKFNIEQLRAVIGLLAGPGVVWQLEFGDFVLLQPEQINSYASALVRKVRTHSDEIGCISEDDVINGNLDYQDKIRLPHNEEQIVLRAMHQILLDHRLCLREHTEKGSLLIFPSYFKRERPTLPQHPLILVTYSFKGVLDEIYATLVVRLHYTSSFEMDKLWRFAADFKTPGGKKLGLKMSNKGEGTAELDLYFELEIPIDIKVMFIKYVHEHLITKAQDVIRFRYYVCPHCGIVLENRLAIEVRLNKGFNDILCVSCEKRVPLWDLIEEKFSSQEFVLKLHKMEEQTKIAIDNESRELILVGHTYAIAGEAGQIYRQYTNSDHGIDGEIEFKTNDGKASGKRLYLQLKSGDSYLYKRKKDDTEVFTIKEERWADYWQQQAYPVMLVIRISDGSIRWMEISKYLKREGFFNEKVKQIIFDGEPFTALNLRRMRDKILGK